MAAWRSVSGHRIIFVTTAPSPIACSLFRMRLTGRLRPIRQPSRRGGQSFAHVWGLTPGQTVFLFAGKFIEKKRPRDFVRAIQQASKRNPAIAGLMVGDGPLRIECEQLVDRFHLPVRFAGFLNQSQIVSSYLAADALVLPSNGEETWGMVINEGMTCGRPCLVSDRVGCGPDLVQSGKTGFIFPLGDVNALTSQMVECAARPEHLAAMGRDAQLRMADYSVAVATDKLTVAISEVLAWA